jgi:putative NADH-flavin reductase
MSRIALIGGTGNVGQRILKEALNRGHNVSVIARNPLNELPVAVNFIQGDVTGPTSTLADLLQGHDVLVSSVRFVNASATQVTAVAREAGIKRVLVVGGAGSLELATGQRLLDLAEFPAAYLPEAAAGAKFLDELRAINDLDWSFLSPAALFEAGERTGTFRLGKDVLLTDSSGNSRISYEDYAVALLDEIEHPKHLRQRFSVAY